MPQGELTKKKLLEYFEYFQKQPEELTKMGQKALDLANMEATEAVVGHCLAAGKE